MKLELKRLSEVDCSEYIALNTNPLVRRQMPLIDDKFDAEVCKEWIKGKEKMWEEDGYGPWAFVVDGKFAGWGGLQPENGDADLGVVLHPDYWGIGKVIYEEIIRRAFGEMRLESVTILFPPTRTRVKGILRLGFKPDGEVKISGERFIRYRLHAPTNGLETY
jgi:[ribosomal protein S5]-alanine N-acetyltransferase